MRLTVYFPEDSPMTHDLVGQKLTVGRLGDNDLQLDDASVSSHHAEIEAGEGVVLRDLGSTNGTYLNGEAVSGELPLKEGDEIYFGSVRAVFMEPSAGAGGGEVTEAPATAAVDADADAAGGGRPENFHYMSVLPRPTEPKDALGLVAKVSAGLGVAAAAAAVAFLLLG